MRLAVRLFARRNIDNFVYGVALLALSLFLVPSIAQVEYRLGESHLVITNALTPVGDFHTRFVSVASFHLPLPAALVRAVLQPLAQQHRQTGRYARRAANPARNVTYVPVDATSDHWRLPRAPSPSHQLPSVSGSSASEPSGEPGLSAG